MYEGILATVARLQALAQHISWPHIYRSLGTTGLLHVQHLAPLGNRVDNIWKSHGYHMVTKLKHQLEQLGDNFGTTF